MPGHAVLCCAVQSRVRLGRVWREGNVHHFVEWMVHTVSTSSRRDMCSCLRGVGEGGVGGWKGAKLVQLGPSGMPWVPSVHVCDH